MILIFTPHNGYIPPAYTLSMVGAAFYLTKHHLPFSYYLNQYCYVPQARNRAVSLCLARPDFTHLMFVDSDLSFPPDAIHRLIQQDKEVVGGIYRKKQEKEEWNVTYIDGDECAIIATGFLLIRRSCLEKMASAYPMLRYSDSDGWHYALFDTYYRDGAFISDDCAFCDRWRAIGGKVYACKEIKLKHIGTKEYE